MHSGTGEGTDHGHQGQHGNGGAQAGVVGYDEQAIADLRSRYDIEQLTTLQNRGVVHRSGLVSPELAN